MDHDLTDERALPVRTRFELAIRRMMDAWLTAGRVRVSAGDVQLAREFLEQNGCKVEEAPEARLRVVSQGRSQEMTREAAVLTALRRLAARR